MLPDDVNDQLGLFGIVEGNKKGGNEAEKQKTVSRKEPIAVTETADAEPVQSEPVQVEPVATEPVQGEALPVEKRTVAPVGRVKAVSTASRKRGKLPLKAKPVSGLVPEGDVRLTANIREDLHLKLKIAAAHRRTTIGELIEDLVDRYL